MFNRDESFGEFDLMRKRRMMSKFGQMPPITGETPPIIDETPAAPGGGRHEAPMQGEVPSMARPSWKNRIGGTLGAFGSMMPEEEESYLEPMQMQPQQGQMLAPQAPNLWAGTMPRKPFRRY